MVIHVSMRNGHESTTPLFSFIIIFGLDTRKYPTNPHLLLRITNHDQSNRGSWTIEKWLPFLVVTASRGSLSILLAATQRLVSGYPARSGIGGETQRCVFLFARRSCERNESIREGQGALFFSVGCIEGSRALSWVNSGHQAGCIHLWP